MKRGRQWRGWGMIIVFVANLICGIQGTAQSNERTNGSQTNRTPGMVRLTPQEQQWIKEHPTIRWGADPHWPPFSDLDKYGKLSGVDERLVGIIARRSGLNIVYVPTASWSETLEKILRHEIDFTTGTSKSASREHKLDFTSVYATFPVAIVTRKETPFLTSLRQLKSKRIAAVRDYVTTDQLQKDYPDLHFYLTDTLEESLQLVSDGDADATIANVAAASYFVHSQKIANLKISGLTHYDFPLRLAVRDDLPVLTSILDKAIDSLTADERDAIYAEYIHPALAPVANWTRWRTRALYATVAGSIIILLVLLWNRRMAVEIRRREQVEADLRNARDTLNQRTDELKQQFAEVEQLNKKLVGVNKELESFSYSISHDLRSPLRHITNFATMLESDTDSKLSSDAQHCVQIISRETDYMQRMVNDLLAYARLGRVEMHRTTVNMEELVKSAIEDLRFETVDRKVAWTVGPLPAVTGDKNLLRQVLANLLGNAVKFTRGRDPATIEVATLPEKANGFTVFLVRDNGAGFNPRLASQLFGVFQRLHSGEQFEGTGIGLANVQRIIHRHGGRVWAEGEPGKGATIYFSLPD